MFKLVDAVTLVWLVTLRQDDLLQTDRCFLCAGDELLVEARDVTVGKFDGSKSGLGQDVVAGRVCTIID